MARVTYDLHIDDEQLQAMAEELGAWNFAKKARKGMNVFAGEFPKRETMEYAMLEQFLRPALKYAGVRFSSVEWQAFLELILIRDNALDWSGK